MDQKGSPLLSDGGNNFLKCGKSQFKIISLYADGFDAGKSLRIFEGIHRSCFTSVCTDIPTIILYKVNDGQLPEGGHLEGFGNLAFCNGGVAE